MPFSLNLKTASRVLTLLLCFNFVACTSTAPRQLAPFINLSPENVSLSDNQKVNSSAVNIDFGLQASINESDSLSNISILPGVRVRSVNSGGPAALAGIKAGDVILSIDQTNTDHPDVLISLSTNSVREQPYSFEVRRDTTVFEAFVTATAITTNAPPLELYRADPVASRAGYRTELVNTNERGSLTAATVVRLFDESPLPAADIIIGDQILSVDGNPVTSAQHLINTLNNDYAQGARVELTLIRDREIINRELQLWNPGTRLNKFSLLPLFNYESSINPDKLRFSLIDLWFISLFSINKDASETDYSILGTINFSTGIQGELLDEND